MKKLIIIVLFLNLWSSAFSQENTKTYTRWYLKPAVGLNIPLTKLFSGSITDNLFEYSDNSFYWQYISATYFFLPNWGLEFTYQPGYSRCISNRYERYAGEIEAEYGDEYFVSTCSGAEYNNSTIISGSIDRGYLGLVYRYERRNYVFLPKLTVGVTSFNTDWGETVLKEKGSNIVYELTYKPGEISNDHFFIAPSFAFGYRLNKWFIVNVDLLYTYFKTDIEYKKQFCNTFTNEVKTETIDYDKNIHTLSVGVSLIFELRHVKY